MGRYTRIIERAKGRGEVAKDIDSSHAGLLFVTPIFYRYLLARRPLDGKWITSHVDKTVALLCQRRSDTE
ncbi:MAG: TetR/AcrR family transcriptional regulator C-terminal ligand-binding domain-containing protein [Gemmatimonadetes bacterium]|nr:TetR/AcrR family transcriptional regulator C-terminal ligand-binding domain-containing protein [Gemmatimonadota bacterium]